MRPSAVLVLSLLLSPGAGAQPQDGSVSTRRFAEVYFGNYHEPAFDLPDGMKIETRRQILARFIQWLGDQIHRDRPWADIVSDMITARGNSAAVPELGYKLSFYGAERQEYSFAGGVSRHHLGISLHCARCHDHPYDRWTESDFYGLGAFNTRQQVRRVASGAEEQVVVVYADEGELIVGPKVYDP
ncbi:MAG: DUF1549 domain-containing protein, partial [Planctomycetes bacterium]|nr:DUF1549 domain-containing protein [Planctomycetota bacterium]